jgi:hypothetical protein
MQEAAQQAVAPDRATRAQIGGETRIVVFSLAKALTPHPHGG